MAAHAGPYARGWAGGQPDGVALPTAFLVADAARLITGETSFVSRGSGM
jgi:hypothetical protein